MIIQYIVVREGARQYRCPQDVPSAILLLGGSAKGSSMTPYMDRLLFRGALAPIASPAANACFTRRAFGEAHRPS